MSSRNLIYPEKAWENNMTIFNASVLITCLADLLFWWSHDSLSSLVVEEEGGRGGAADADVGLACEQAHVGAQARGVQPWAQNRAANPRDEKVSLLWSLQIFHFHPGNCRKNKPTNFHQKYELWQLRFLGISQQHAGMIYIVDKVLPMSSKDTHLHVIPSDHALGVWSLVMLVNG